MGGPLRILPMATCIGIGLLLIGWSLGILIIIPPGSERLEIRGSLGEYCNQHTLTAEDPIKTVYAGTPDLLIIDDFGTNQIPVTIWVNGSQSGIIFYSQHETGAANSSFIFDLSPSGRYTEEEETVLVFFQREDQDAIIHYEVHSFSLDWTDIWLTDLTGRTVTLTFVVGIFLILLGRAWYTGFYYFFPKPKEQLAEEGFS